MFQSSWMPTSTFQRSNWSLHWVEHICGHGALHQYSGARHEQPHKTNLKDAWKASNHNLNYLLQVITFQHRIICFKIRELNLQALAQRWENSTAACKVLPSRADLVAPLRSQSTAKPKLMGPQNRRDGKHPDAMIKDFRAILDNIQDTMHRMAIYSGTGEFIDHDHGKKTYLSDVQLHAMELCIHHGIKVQVEGLDGERISQMCRCTGCQSWRGGDRKNDWVWVKQCPGRCYSVQNGHLPWQLQRLFLNQTPKRGWCFRWVLVSAGAQHNTWILRYLGSRPEICTSAKCIGSCCFTSFLRENHSWLRPCRSRDSY